MSKWIRAAIAATAVLCLVGGVAYGAVYLARVEYGIRWVSSGSRPDNCTGTRVCDWFDGTYRQYYNGSTDQKFVFDTSTVTLTNKTLTSPSIGTSIVPSSAYGADNGTSAAPWDETYTRHIVGKVASVPTCAAGAALGSGGSPGCTCTGSDTAMECTFVTGSASTTTGTMGTITFNTAFASNPYCVLTFTTQATQTSIGWSVSPSRADGSASTLVLKTGTAPTAGGSSYPVAIHCIQ